MDCRALHWVLKVGNLEKSITFFSEVFELRVLRHEEFLTGCEATCNGPYGGAWSKTMIGYGPEEENFALELTYNYGVDHYEFGNDLQYISIIRDVESARAAASRLGYLNEIRDDHLIITGPDSYKFKVLSPFDGQVERFVTVALKVGDIEVSKKFWKELLGMREVCSMEGSHPSLLLTYESNDNGVTCQTKLLLVQTVDGIPVLHAEASGRIAFSTLSIEPIYKAVTAAGAAVLTPPLTLRTPGKADVVVTILCDPDGYEICFVEAEGFYQLAVPTYDKIDFEERRLKFK